MSNSHDDPNWTRFLMRWLALSFVLHGVATFLSSGFYHSDEHFQILEFLGSKLGRGPVSELPIEFAQKMRPWLEPGILYLFSRLWMALGIQDPFVWTLSFRALSSILGWGSIALLALCCRYWFASPALRRAAVISLSLLWYLPAFHARLASENWGGAVFTLGLCVFLLTRVYQRIGPAWLWATLGGFLFGLAFEFRYQVGVMVAGALLWLWIRAKVPRREIAFLVIGLVSAIVLGTGVDAWGYGHWVFAPWNYIDFNLVRGMVARMDTDPWWDLFRRAFTESWPLLGLILLLSLPVAWLTHPLHVLTWTQLPLFLTHALIGHKELRFLYPMAHAAPVLLILAAEGIGKWIRGGPYLVVAFRALLAWNLLALAITSVIPAWMPIRFQEYVWHFPERDSSGELVIHWKDRSPYNVNGITMNFYRPSTVRLIQIQSYDQVIAEIVPGQPYWLFYDAFTLSGDAEPLKTYCHLQFQALPAWIESLAGTLHVTMWLRHVTDWSLYRCEKS